MGNAFLLLYYHSAVGLYIYEDRSVFVYINVETVYPFPPTELYSYVVFIAIDEKKSRNHPREALVRTHVPGTHVYICGGCRLDEARASF